MKLLLDTHIWVWTNLKPERLSRKVSKVIANTANDIWISPVSVWELSMLVKKGRIDLKKSVEEWTADAFHSMQIQEASVTTDVALAVNKIRLPHDDPADAFLVATASVFELTLVTADEKLLAAKHISTLAND
jgi:PIN domain nuclease of toxin-antitoxin system